MADALVEKVLAAAEDPYGLLSLSPLGVAVTDATPLADSRRCYVRLAAVIHPDKCDNPRATEAFQALVRAFEAIANPDVNAKKPQQQQQQQQKKKRSSQSSDNAASKQKKPRTTRSKAPSKPKAEKKAKKARKGGDSEDDDDEEEEDATSEEDEVDDEVSAEDDDDDDDDALLGTTSSSSQAKAQAQAQRQQKVADLKARNQGCFRTQVACPNCPDIWVPDDNRLYTLFMSFGIKIHCQACLFKFGCVTSKHFCPHCARAVDYDPSMYHSKTQCGHCRKPFGFTFYPISDELLDSVKKAAKAEADHEAKLKARQTRAARGAGDASTDTNRLDELIGQCIVDEQCPICRKKVASKHRTHVTACHAAPPPPPKRSRAATVQIVDDDGRIIREPKKPRAKRATPVAKKAVPSAAAPSGAAAATSTKPTTVSRKPTAPDPKPKASKPKPKPKARTASKAPTTRKRRRAGSDDDSEEDDDSDGSSSSAVSSSGSSSSSGDDSDSSDGSE